MRKICVVSGTRADYGLLYWTIRGIKESKKAKLQLIATGMHLSEEYGMTYRQIEEDGFIIDKRIEISLSDNNKLGVSKSIGLGISSFAKAYDELQPDLILLLGDRFEILAAATAATIATIPIAHCHGGETTEGAFDESIRHSITKMSHLHFTSTSTYKKRVIQLGEQPEKVFNVGALGIENINKLKLLNKEEFESSINFKLSKHNLLVTFHPVTLENSTAKEQFSELLTALDELKETLIIFTKPNADTDGRIISEMIDEYVSLNNQKAISFISLGQLRYISALQFVDMVVGNSSSGIIEAPSFNIPTINIGDRQKGRVSGKSVLHCKPESKSILDSIKKVSRDNYIKTLREEINPYDGGNSSEKIIPILLDTALEGILKKKFYDIS